MTFDISYCQVVAGTHTETSTRRKAARAPRPNPETETSTERIATRATRAQSGMKTEREPSTALRATRAQSGMETEREPFTSLRATTAQSSEFTLAGRLAQSVACMYMNRL